jgi:hypothetical protein
VAEWVTIGRRWCEWCGGAGSHYADATEYDEESGQGLAEQEDEMKKAGD